MGSYRIALQLSIAAVLTVGNVDARIPNERSITGTVLRSGITATAGPQEDVAAPHTAAGRKSTFDVIRVVKETDRIPAKLGVSFGFEYRLLNLPIGQPLTVEVRALHPPITGKDGKTRTISTAQMEVPTESGQYEDVLIYRLSEPYEVVPGRWVLEILHNGRHIFSKEYRLE